MSGEGQAGHTPCDGCVGPVATHPLPTLQKPWSSCTPGSASSSVSSSSAPSPTRSTSGHTRTLGFLAGSSSCRTGISSCRVNTIASTTFLPTRPTSASLQVRLEGGMEWATPAQAAAPSSGQKDRGHSGRSCSPCPVGMFSQNTFIEYLLCARHSSRR